MVTPSASCQHFVSYSMFQTVMTSCRSSFISITPVVHSWIVYVQISGAFVKLHDPHANGDRELEIVGTHEQTQAAQNLVNTFLLVAALPTQVRVVMSPDGNVLQGQTTVGTGLAAGAVAGATQYIVKQE